MAYRGARAIQPKAYSPVELAQFIAANLPLVPVPDVPEIRLHKAGPKSGLWRLAARDEEGFSSPYWAHWWGGGLALARYLREHPESVTGKRVLDLGTGSGLVAIAAALAGAREVIAVDADRYAVIAAQLNAEANGVTLQTVLADLTGGAPPDAEVILAGDVFYEPQLAGRMTRYLACCRDAGIAVLIGDPWRAFLPRERLAVVAEYEVADFASAAARVASAVLKFPSY